MCWIDPQFKSTFPLPPLTAFKRPRNIKSHIIRAKVFTRTEQREKRKTTGMFKCNRPCLTCPFVKQESKVKGKGFTWNIKQKFTCNTDSIVYLIQCAKEKCNLRYIGVFERRLSERITDHRGYINNNVTSQPTGLHFNEPGHKLSDLTVTILEQVKRLDTKYRKNKKNTSLKKLIHFTNGLTKCLRRLH